MTEQQKGAAVVVQPDEGQSFWQPVPANGYAEVRISRRNDSSIRNLVSGIQVIAPGCFIREHQHSANEEVLFFFEGEGKAIIDGEEHEIRAGTTIFLGPFRKHKFINTGPGDLKMFWVLMPGGLDDFFEQIGRPRRPGEPAPAPFPRPDNVEEIERKTVFVPLES